MDPKQAYPDLFAYDELVLRPGIGQIEGGVRLPQAIEQLQELLTHWTFLPEEAEVEVGVFDDATLRAVQAFQNVASSHKRRIPEASTDPGLFVEAPAITLHDYLPGACCPATLRELALWLQNDWCWMGPRYIEEATSRWASPGPYTASRGAQTDLKLGSLDNEGEAALRAQGKAAHQNTYHEYVYGLQCDLHELGFGFCGNDGWFGPETERAVRAFQRFAATNTVREQAGNIIQVETSYHGASDGVVGDLSKAELTLWLDLEYRLPRAPETDDVELSGDLEGLLKGVRERLDPQGRQALVALTRKLQDGTPILALGDEQNTLLAKLYTFAQRSELHPFLARAGWTSGQALRDLVCVLADPQIHIHESELSPPEIVRICRELAQLAPNLYCRLVCSLATQGRAEVEGGVVPDTDEAAARRSTQIIDVPLHAYREDFSCRCLMDRLLQETLRELPGVMIALQWLARGVPS